jgi:murein DD-endopeptidase MepM/ murein hydrolase activator NlpD
MGRQQEAQLQQAPSIAKMKADIAASNYSLANQQEALGMLQPLLGTSNPQQTQQAIASGNVPTNLLDQIDDKTLAMLEFKYPQLGNALKTAMTMAIERQKLGQSQRTNDIQLGEKLASAGPEFLNLLPAGSYKGQDQTGMGISPAQMPVQAPVQAPVQTAPQVAPSPAPTAAPAPAEALAPTPVAQPAPSAQPAPQVQQVPLSVEKNIPSPGTNGLNFTPPVSNAQLSSGFGQRPNPFDKTQTEFHKGVDFAAPEGSPIQAVKGGTVKTAGTNGVYGNYVEVDHGDGSSSYYGHLKNMNVKQGDKIPDRAHIGTVGATGKTTGPHVEFGVKVNGVNVDPNEYFKAKHVETARPQPYTPPTKEEVKKADEDLMSLPLNERNKVKAERLAKANEGNQALLTEIRNTNPAMLQNSLESMKKLNSFATHDAHLWGLMQKQGMFQGLLNAAQEGATLDIPSAQMKLNLPVEKFLQTVKFNPEDQAKIREIGRIFGQEFLNNVKTNKGLLGVNPTDNDARLLAAPMATIADSSKAVQHWTRQHALDIYQKMDLQKAYQQHEAVAGKTADPGLFFRPESRYHGILKDYSDARMKLFNQFYGHQ